MTAIFDYASNAACPQRPTWQISPIGYKWAQEVLLVNKPIKTVTGKKRKEHCMEGVKSFLNVLSVFLR